MAKKILVVDDEQHMRIFVTTLLETSGFKPISAEDGKQGLELARQKKPDAIILDVMMPKESGFEMYRELKRDADLKNIPVIIVSGLARKTFLHSHRLLDMHQGEAIPEPAGYIEKPPEADELLDTLQKVLAA
ncbi:MAG TPA: response regulator [Syntrophobacteraceae bacterium]|nr:response regulator [Syntrophobacteraceae bacterium]HBZ54218.1 response regulator [Syntrophobacteraceae bacterium]